MIHFSHADFRRCKIMDGHLAVSPPLCMGHAARTDPFGTSTFSTQAVAAKHPETLFLKADVANAPWLVVKMSVKILPCLIAFVGGAAKDKCVLLACLHTTSGGG